jgi:hypothetical protein
MNVAEGLFWCTVSEIVEAITAEQIEQVRSLFRQYQAELPLQYCFRSFDAELSGLPGEYGPQGKLLLATVSGQPAYVTAVTDSDRVCNIAQTAICRLRNPNSVGTQRFLFSTMIGGIHVLAHFCAWCLCGSGRGTGDLCPYGLYSQDERDDPPPGTNRG